MSDVEPTTEFGDLDPEDAYDAGDPPAMRLAVIRRIAAALRDQPDDGRLEYRRTDALCLLDNLERDEPGLEQLELAELRAELETL